MADPRRFHPGPTRIALVASPLLLVALASSLPLAAQQYTIKDDQTGGDCAQIGTWDAATKTCGLGASLTGSITIADNEIQFDGHGFALTHGPGAANKGVQISGRTGVVLRSLTIVKFDQGVSIVGGGSNSVLGCLLAGPAQDIGIFLHSTNENNVRGNRVISHGTSGIYLSSSKHNLVTDNQVSLNGESQISLAESHDNVVAKNLLSGGDTAKGLVLLASDRNIISENNIMATKPTAVVLDGAHNRLYFNTIGRSTDYGIEARWSNNLIFCNNFSDQIWGVAALPGSLANETWWNNFFTDSRGWDAGAANRFHHPAPEGGNYWQRNAPNCVDANLDDICDAPYVFFGNQDALPHVRPIPWATDPSICFPDGVGLQPPEPPDSDSAALVAAVMRAVEAHDLGPLAERFGPEVELATDAATLHGSTAIVQALDATLGCAAKSQQVELVDDPNPGPVAMVDLRVADCGGRALRLVVEASRAQPGAARRVRRLVMTTQP